MQPRLRTAFEAHIQRIGVNEQKPQGRARFSVWLAGRMELGVAIESVFRFPLGPDYLFILTMDEH